MATTATPKQFAIQQVFEILLRKPSDKSIVAYLTNCKTSGLENTLEMVYPSGGRGNTYIGRGFAHSKHSKINVEVATWNTDVLATQNGTEVATGAATVTQYDRLTIATNKATTTRKAAGTTGAEIKYAYKVLTDGTYGATFEQAETAATGKFTYDSATKAITFFTGDLADGDTIACAYDFATTDAAQRINVTTDGIPPLVEVTAYGLAADICGGELFPVQLQGDAQMDGNWNWDLSADGDPAVQSMNLEFTKSCFDNTLYDITVYTDEDPA